MADRDETLLPLLAWTDVLRQLTLPFRAYPHQLVRAYEPVLLLGGQALRAYAGWMRFWERLVYWERQMTIAGSPGDVSDRETERGTSPVSAAGWPGDRRRSSADPGVGSHVPAAATTAYPAALGPVRRSSSTETERVVADLASALEAVLTQLDHLASTMVGMLDQQMELLALLAARPEHGTSGEGKQATR